MPSFHLNHLHLQLNCGRILFNDLNWHHHHHRSALIGQNGVGKSLLAQLLIGELKPTSGDVSVPQSVGYFAQSHVLAHSKQTIAQFLAVDSVLYALEQVAKGQIEQHWFDTIGECWQIHDELTALMKKLRLPTDLNLPVARLSGGQQATLTLWRLFNEPRELLILDEPSNHLDHEGKVWFLEQMQRFKGAILLISHDRLLLENIEHIYELDSLGLHHYAGNYSSYVTQKHTEQQAVERQLMQVKREQQRVVCTVQQNQEKAQQRAQQGRKLSRQGSQPKILQDFKKGRASAQLARAVSIAHERKTDLQQRISQLQQRQADSVTQQVYLQTVSQTSGLKTLLRANQCVLPFGQSSPLTFQVLTGQKWHVTGTNGAGKSTLFKVFQGQLQVQSGSLVCNAPVFCLDQHASIFNTTQSVIDELNRYCPHISHSDGRTLLAGIGLRGDTVKQHIETLSGGQKMKLAMLIVSHQQSQPILLLDEPDNHLDLASKAQLAQALNMYQGTFLLISHDEHFAAKAGTMQVINL